MHNYYSLHIIGIIDNPNLKCMYSYLPSTVNDECWATKKFIISVFLPPPTSNIITEEAAKWPIMVPSHTLVLLYSARTEYCHKYVIHIVNLVNIPQDQDHQQGGDD